MAVNVKIQKPADSVVPSPDLVALPDDYLLSELEGNKHVDEKIREMIKKIISTDKEVDQEIEKIVKKIETEKVKIFWTKIGAALWSIAMIILGALLSVIIKKFQ
ncbi:MAG: hypothetical protein ACD_37C00234G0004 [uncultured bacterium]|nr:MAG: hypothetical protein ACD_37C00234G0004 [uncultured bacterium]